MAQGRAHGNQVAARVIADLIIARESQREIAEQNGISEGSISNIKARYLLDFERLKNTAPDADSVLPLVTNLLTQSLVTLTVQLEQFGDKDWLATQSAGDLAILHGVIADKTLRLLAAAQRPVEPFEQVELELEQVAETLDSDGGAPAGEQYALE